MEEIDALFLADLSVELNKHGYRMLEPLGKGGFATVYRIWSTKYEQDFVAKVIIGERDRETSRIEIEALISLIHPNIISIYDHFTVGDSEVLCLEFCTGGTIADLVRREGPMSGNMFRKLAGQIATALKYCHDHHIAHRDIKPSNILIDKWGRPKLADFGLCHRNTSHDLLKDFCGSRVFMAPELVNKQRYNPFKTDVWSLGVTFYFMVVGTVPFNTRNHKQRDKAISMGLYSFPASLEIPRDIIELIRRMMCVDPTRRYSIDNVCSSSALQFDAPEKKKGRIRKHSSLIFINGGKLCGFQKAGSPLTSDLALPQTFALDK